MIDIFKDIGATQIAKELTESDYSTKLGNTNWSESSVRGILKNVKYKYNPIGGALIGKNNGGRNYRRRAYGGTDAVGRGEKGAAYCKRC